ncbi:uncharacterized protein LOC128473690 [Spea bombifrons]|uniref:uncharacterized protein LOC128473690 n=1 Tax=Spea bombifrons TaxID=233779 RepID=UPI00234BD30F|nr:uncharacterized protein LOC128473690 [Spea bombifrons]
MAKAQCRISCQKTFSEPWLNACYNETLLPGSPWHKVLHKIGAVLAEKVKPVLKEPKKKEIIFKLLGKDFVQTYFSTYTHFPSLLCPPNTTDAEYETLEKQTQIWLLDQCTKAAEQVGCYPLDGDLSELSVEMAGFVNHTYSIVEKGLELLLAKHEEKQKACAPGVDQSMLRSFSKQHRKSVDSNNLHFALGSAVTFEFKNVNVGPELRPTVFNCAGSEVLSDAISAMILSDSSNMMTVCEKLSGRLLPKTLRKFIWMEKLLKSDYNEENTQIIEKVTREKYGKALEHKLAELKLRSATRSPISGLIENAVVEKYGSTPCMQNFAGDEKMILESSKTLNVLYVYDGTYEPYLIHWLFPIQLAFKQTLPTAEHPYELFMYLHLLMKNRFPSWLEIFAMAEHVMNTLKTEDIELYTHLQCCLQRNIAFDPKDFLVELIAQEREDALNLYAGGNKFDNPAFQKELLANPVIFLRKWMGEGFVNSLDLPAVLLIWDQLFMQDWNLKVMESFCMAVLMLLKDSIMSAEDYPAIRQILLHDGCHLFTSDIQRAWIHLQQGGLLADIPEMNRFKKKQFHEQSLRLQAGRDSGIFRKICSVGVKDIVMKLILQQKAEATQACLQEFDPTSVRLKLSLFYGDMMLSSKTNSMEPSLCEEVKLNKGGDNEVTAFTVQFKDIYEFNSVDPSNYLNGTDFNTQPFIVLQAVYTNGERDLLTLGWTQVEAFEEQTINMQNVWKPQHTSLSLSLHPGRDPDNVTEKIPGCHMSSIQLTVYDPTKETQTTTGVLNRVKQNERNAEPMFLSMPSWVQHNKSTMLPSPTSLQQAFDLYVDGLHYIPDNATITKVSGRIVNSGRKDVPQFVAFPEPTSSARNPEFNFHCTLNPENKMLNAATSILFQVSTMDSSSRNVALIGNCIFRAFNEEGKLNVGGFQLKLRTGLPSKQQDSLVASDLHQYPAFPCCSLLIRLLPNSERHKPVPKYSLGYYFTDEAKPTRFEWEIMSTFQKDANFPKLVKDMAGCIMEKEQSQAQENQLQDLLEKRFGGQKSSLLQPSLNYISVHHAVQYRQEIGIRLRIRQAFGLAVEGLYTNAFARIMKGAQSIHLPELPQRWGGEEKVLTQKHDFASLQKSPRWTDNSVLLHPYLDQQSVLLVQIFGMNATYIPNQNTNQRGHVLSRNGQDLQLEPVLGWTVVPLFDRNYVNSGIHSAPLFQGLPNADFLQSLSSHPLKVAIQEGLKKKTVALLKSYGSVTVEMWDGHYLDDEHYPLPVVNDLLTVDNIKKFLTTQNSKKGKEMSMLVLQSLDKKQQKLQTDSPEYQRHQHFFEEAMAGKFYDLIEMALLNAGYGPL